MAYPTIIYLTLVVLLVRGEEGGNEGRAVCVGARNISLRYCCNINRDYDKLHIKGENYLRTVSALDLNEREGRLARSNDIQLTNAYRPDCKNSSLYIYLYFKDGNHAGEIVSYYLQIRRKESAVKNGRLINGKKTK